MTDGTRDAMIAAARRLLAERGLEGTSTREVLARTGAPRGSVYHHFPRGRTELIEEAIALAQEQMGGWIDAIQAMTPAEVVCGYLGIWQRILEATDCQAGCSIAGVITGTREADLLDRSAAAYAAATDALAAQFRKVGMPEADAAEQAAQLIIAAEGAVLISRAQRSTEPLRLVARQFTRALDNRC
jgi:TetR/AcrR family transcriptional regulator, lmrAB and yxaGH operons repressor